MSNAAPRLRRLFTAFLAGIVLIGSGIVIDRVLLGGAAGDRSLLETSDDESGSSLGDHADDHSHDEEPQTEQNVPSGAADIAPRIEFSAGILDNIGLTTQVVGLGPIERTLRFPGTVRMHPDGMAVLSARIEGKVVSVAVAPGDRVRQGQVLARIQSLVPGSPPPTVELVAPITGIVARRDAIVGEAVEPDKELLRLIDPRHVVVEARVPERIVDRIRLEQRARVRRLRDHRRSSGRVSFVGSEADPVTRTYPVWVELSLDEEAPPLPGQFVDILVIESRETALSVPQQAIVEQGPLCFVFVQRGHAFEQRLVQTGAEDDENVEVVSGLEAGDTVAVAGSYELLLALQSGGPPRLLDESAPHEH